MIARLWVSTAVLLLLLVINANAQTTYFVDADAGHDSLDGMSELTAWQTLGKINGITFQPGDTILLKRECTWTGYLSPKGSGVAGSPIIISSYGTGALPRINTSGQYLTALLLWNQQYWEVEDLELTNLHPSNPTTTRYGVYLLANDAGTIRHLVLRDLVVHDVNGNPASKTCGGIFFEVSGGATQTWFDSVVVEGCDIFDVSPVGIANTSSWATRTLTTNTSWIPSTNIIIRNNTIRRTVRNGMIIRVADRPLLEHNVLHECAKDSSGNALFVFNCDNAMIQFNEAFLTRFNSGDEDAGGFDGDYRCKNTLIQYNYSHNNEYGGIVVVSDGGGTNTFNDGTIVRYNVLKDNLGHCIRISGNVTNTLVYNNTIYSGAATSAVVAIWHKSWGGYCDHTRYYNNIFEIQKFGSSYQLGSSTNNLFDYNLFHGTRAAGEPDDAHKLTSDPQFADVASVGDGWSSAAGFQLVETSAAINSGLKLPDHSTHDYQGDPVPYDSVVDRGAFEYQLPVSVGESGSILPIGPTLDQAYPNPFNPVTRIRFSLSRPDDVRLSVSNLLGQEVATLVSGHRTAGEYHVTFDGTHLSSGVYLYTLRAGAFVETKRFLLMK